MRIESPLVLAIGRLQRATPSPEASRPEPLRGLRGSDDGVRVTLSPQAREAAGAAQPGTDASGRPTPEIGPTRELSAEEKRQVAEFARRDREVHAHEAAHKAAAGGLSRGGATFSYETGPDGKRYAVGGEVSIDTTPIKGDPEATERKMRQVQQAALAPAEPSSQDRKVAATAAAQAHAAQAEQLRESEDPSPLGPPSSEPTIATSTAPDEAQQTSACSECGGRGHGPEAHRTPVNTFA